MNTGPRTPPRFVPTLTAVFDQQAVPPQAPPVEEQVPMLPALPQDEPQWNAVAPVAEAPFDAPVVQSPPPAAPTSQVAVPPGWSDADGFRVEEELVHRVLQRIDLSLEERLTEVVSAAVQQQLDVMVPRLRSEIETVLRTLVVDALARELPENPGSETGSGAPALG